MLHKFLIDGFCNGFAFGVHMQLFINMPYMCANSINGNKTFCMQQLYRICLLQARLKFLFHVQKDQ